MSGESISFTAAVAQVKTLADGGIRVALDLPETAVMAAAQLMECKRQGVVLQVDMLPMVEEKPDGL